MGFMGGGVDIPYTPIQVDLDWCVCMLYVMLPLLYSPGVCSGGGGGGATRPGILPLNF